MTTYSERLAWLDAEELLEELQACLEFEDSDLAHERADEILVAALVLAVNERISRNVAAELVNTYHEVNLAPPT